MEISIREFQVESIEQSMYSVTFERQDVLYRLRGIINREEMEKIVENLFFLLKMRKFFGTHLFT